MPLYTTLASLSQTAASNVADGSVDAPSAIDQQTNLLASFIAQLRDGNGFATGLANVGQCRLTKSGSNLLLSPYGGNGLTINGVVYKIPSAGVTLAPGAFSAGTTYYIYAYMNAGTMTLEGSTTTHATDTTTGVEIKSGDATRTLVGMARPIAGPAWQDAINQRFVVSWFNRLPLALQAPLGSIASTASSAYTEVSTNLRNEFLLWLGSSASLAVSGGVYSSLATAATFTAIAVDGTVLEGYNQFQSINNNSFGGMGVNSVFSGTEGYHLATVYGHANSAATSNWIGGSTVGERTTHVGIVWG